MHPVLRERLMRRLETLPDDQVYQVLDYIEFLESKYAESELREEATGLQRFGERLEDSLRKRTIGPGTLREAFHLIAAADRVLSGVASAGRDLLGEVDGERTGPRKALDVRGRKARATGPFRPTPPPLEPEDEDGDTDDDGAVGGGEPERG